MRQKAMELSQELLILDSHQDLPYRLILQKGTKKQEDVSKRTEQGHFDYPRAREGGLDGVFLAAYVPARYEESGGAKALADEGIELIRWLAEKHPDKFLLVETAEQMGRGELDGRVRLGIGIENGTSLEGKLANLEYFYDKSVRYITLCHSKCNRICDSSFDDERRWGGLSEFGCEVVAGMNGLGMMIDVSHVSDEAFYQVLKLSTAPVVATHSSCRHFTPGWERNMDDEMIRSLAKKGGVIQIAFGSMFVNGEINRETIRHWDYVKQYIRENSLSEEQEQEFTRQYRRDNPIASATVSDVADHIDHVVKLAGIEHVGLGTDYDGVGNMPRGLEDVSGYPNLIYELLRRSYDREGIRKICGGNFLRVWKEVEKVGAKS
ncbi:MAG: dipeptidase [Sedimentisphaerales bacterium]|nr:dipeptidase [Sedimentisphaerales bacterium]